MGNNGVNGSSFIRLKGTNLKLDLSKDAVTKLRTDSNNESIFQKLDKNKDGNIADDIQDAAGNLILSKREAKKAGIDWNSLNELARLQQGEKTNKTVASSSKIEPEGKFKDKEGNEYTVKHNTDGGYTRIYKDKTRNYDNNGNWISGRTSKGIDYTRTYKDDGSSVEKYSDGNIFSYDANDECISRKNSDGTEYRFEYNHDGSFRSVSVNPADGSYRDFDKDSREIGGRISKGITYTRTYKDDGSSIEKYSDGDIVNYDKDGRKIGGKISKGPTYTIIYKNDIQIFEFENGFIGGLDKNNHAGVAKKTKNGDIKASPLNGESFVATMNRLGITDPADQELFRKANSAAAKRGYFRVGMMEITIPKIIADKINIVNAFVDDDVQIQKYKKARRR